MHCELQRIYCNLKYYVTLIVIVMEGQAMEELLKEILVELRK